MASELEQIILDLLCPDTSRIKEATMKWNEASKNPNVLGLLFDFIRSNRPVEIRQYSATLLHKCLETYSSHWQMLHEDKKAELRVGLLHALFMEKITPVREKIANIVRSLSDVEKDNSLLNEFLEKVVKTCSSENPNESEWGSTVFVTLVNADFDFDTTLSSICQMFKEVLLTAERQGDMCTPTIENIMAGIAYLVPNIKYQYFEEHCLNDLIPLIVKSFCDFVYKPLESFKKALSLVENIFDISPGLLKSSMKILIKFCLKNASSTLIEDTIRMEIVYFIGAMAHTKYFLKAKYLESTLVVLLDLLCCDFKDELEDIYSNEIETSVVVAALYSLDMLASYYPEMLVRSLRQRVNPYLLSPDPLHRGGAFLYVSAIASGCSASIDEDLMDDLIIFVKAGTKDVEPSVRMAAFYTICEFSEYLQPDVIKYVSEILPILVAFLEQSTSETKMGNPQPKHLDRILVSLNEYLEALDDEIVPYLSLVMKGLFEIHDPIFTEHTKELGLTAIATVVDAAGINILPYFEKIVGIIKAYLITVNCPSHMNGLRNHAITVLAVLAQSVGKEKFMPLVDDTMKYCLTILENGCDDPYLKCALYNLVAIVSGIVNEQMGIVFPSIMNTIMNSLIHCDKKSSQADADSDEVSVWEKVDPYECEFRGAIEALGYFANQTGESFAPYIQAAFEAVFKMLDHKHSVIRAASCSTLCDFIESLNRMGNLAAMKLACQATMPKFVYLLRKDKQVNVLSCLLEGLGTVFQEVKHAALPTAEIAENIFNCLNLLMNNFVVSDTREEDDNDEDAKEYDFDENLYYNAINLLPQMGHALTSEHFEIVFTKILPILEQLLAKFKKDNGKYELAILYGALANSCVSLGARVAPFYAALFKIFIEDSNDSCKDAKMSSIFGLGQLVENAKQQSFEDYPQILSALMTAISEETHSETLDNICATIASLIVTNYAIVPLHEVLPIYFSNLPIREATEKWHIVLRSFEVLYVEYQPNVIIYIEQIIINTIHALTSKNRLTDTKYIQNATLFVKTIFNAYPEKCAIIVNSSTEILSFVQSLQHI